MQWARFVAEGLWIHQKEEARVAPQPLWELKAVVALRREETEPWERMAWQRRQPVLWEQKVAPWKPELWEAKKAVLQKPARLR